MRICNVMSKRQTRNLYWGLIHKEHDFMSLLWNAWFQTWSSFTKDTWPMSSWYVQSYRVYSVLCRRNAEKSERWPNRAEITIVQNKNKVTKCCTIFDLQRNSWPRTVLSALGVCYPRTIPYCRQILQILTRTDENEIFIYKFINYLWINTQL